MSINTTVLVIHGNYKSWRLDIKKKFSSTSTLHESKEGSAIKLAE